MKSSGMGTGSASPIVLLAMLAVVALLAASSLAAARPSGTDDGDTIRLPSSGRRSAAGGGDVPWECCDWVVQHPSFRPPKWQCNDVAAECSPDCHDCEESSGPAGDGYVCRDWIVSLFQPPVCTPRPWDCCDAAICDRKLPPTCRCADKVESCPSNCKECELVGSDDDPPLYRCLDRFDGFPGPKCTPWIAKGN